MTNIEPRDAAQSRGEGKHTAGLTGFDLTALYAILARCTSQYRKGEPIVKRSAGGLDVVEVFAMPHVSEAPAGIEPIDVHFITVGVDRTAAERDRDGLITILNHYPDPDQLRGGPSYITVGGVVGDQGAALQLFALGRALGLWSIITPATFGMTGAEADQAAGAGFVMITGYSAAKATAQ